MSWSPIPKITSLSGSSPRFLRKDESFTELLRDGAFSAVKELISSFKEGRVGTKSPVDPTFVAIPYLPFDL